MEAELKTDESLKTLPTFNFKTDLPMQSLTITSDEQGIEQKSANGIIETRKDDTRADDGRKRVRLIASSDATDLVGDVMSKNALNQMKDAAVGTTIFLNHDSTVPDSVFGAVEKAELVTRNFTVVDGGKKRVLSLICLEYDVLVEETHDRAVKVWDMINAGTTKLGASITIAIVEKSPLSGGRRQIDSVIYLETSIVGIPCNQTAWVQYVKSFSWVQQASKSLKALTSKEEPVAIPDGEPVDIDSLFEKKEAVVEEIVPSTIDNSSEQSSKTEVEPVIIPPPVPFFAVGAKSNTTSELKEIKMETLRIAKTVKDAVTAFKDMFTDAVEEHFENPWLYMYILEDCMMELIYWNSNMPTDDKLAAANEFIDAFKVKMMEILTAYWSEEDAEKSAAMQKQFNEAATKHLQFLMKEGRRNNTSDAATIQKIHDMSCNLGAGCAEEKTVKTEAVAKGSEVAPVAGEVETPPAAVEAPDATETAAALEAANAKNAELEAANKELTEKVARLETEKKGLETQSLKWKAGALTAKAMLADHLNQPAPRPGASTN